MAQHEFRSNFSKIHFDWESQLDQGESPFVSVGGSPTTCGAKRVSNKLPPFSLLSLSFPQSILVRALKSSMNEFAFHITRPSIKIAESNGIEPVALM